MIFRRGLIFLLTVVSTGCHRKPKTSRDQVSYAIGMQFGRSLKAQKLDIDVKLVNDGVSDALGGERPALSDEEMQAAMAALGRSQQDRMKAEADRAKISADHFLSANASADGVKTTKSGLQYRINKPGTGPSPGANDTVVVHYRGTLIDGTEFDSSYARKTPAEFPVAGVIPGWTEGLRLMKKGGATTIYVPPHLGYGDRSRQQIPANAVLIFDVELIDVKPTIKAPGR